MKPFSLSAVLKYRKQLEETAAAKLAQAQLELQQKQRELSNLNRKYDELLTNLAAAQQGGIRIEELLQYEHHLSWLQEQKMKLATDLDATGRKVQDKRRIVVERSREKKVLEKLKTKQNAAWRRYLDKKEAAQLDEIAILSHEKKSQQF